MNPLFRDAFRLRVDSVIAAAATLGRLNHPGLVGQLREVLMRELLRPAMPATVAFGTGKIVDHTGAESKQIDIVVYDTRLMPPLLYGQDETLGLFPVESCLYAIEVKSKVTPAEMRKAVGVAESLGRLRYVPEFTGPSGHPRERVIPALIALDSTARSSAAEEARWRECQNGKRDLIEWETARDVWQLFQTAPLRVVCVFGRGYGYYSLDRQSFGWLEARSDRSEILSCIAGIANTVFKQAELRQGLPFGRYIL